MAGFWESTVAVLAPASCPVASSQGISCFEGYSITNLPAALSRGVCDCQCITSNSASGGDGSILATSSTSCNSDCASSIQCVGGTVTGSYSSQQTYLATFPAVGSVAEQPGTICVSYGVASCNSSISNACYDPALDGATYTKYFTVTSGSYCSSVLADLGTTVAGQPQQYTFFTMCSSNNCNSAPPPPPPPPPSPPPATSGFLPVKPVPTLAILVFATYFAHV